MTGLQERKIALKLNQLLVDYIFNNNCDDYNPNRGDVEVVEWDDERGHHRVSVPRNEYLGDSLQVATVGDLRRLEEDGLFRDRVGISHATPQEIKRRSMDREGNKKIVD